MLWPTRQGILIPVLHKCATQIIKQTMILITDNKHYNEPSVFTPENLLREARRQKNIKNCKVPDVCVLDPDGDLVDYLIRTNQATINECWACYHTKLYNVKQNDLNLQFWVVA
jgi:hypothetical protein